MRARRIGLWFIIVGVVAATCLAVPRSWMQFRVVQVARPFMKATEELERSARQAISEREHTAEADYILYLSTVVAAQAMVAATKATYGRIPAALTERQAAGVAKSLNRATGTAISPAGLVELIQKAKGCRTDEEWTREEKAIAEYCSVKTITVIKRVQKRYAVREDFCAER